VTWQAQFINSHKRIHSSKNMPGEREQFFYQEEVPQNQGIEKDSGEVAEVVVRIDAEKSPEQYLQELAQRAKEFALEMRLNEKLEQAEELHRFSKEGGGKLKKPVFQEKSKGNPFKKGVRLAFFASTGIKNPSQMVELIDYLEDTVAELRMVAGQKEPRKYKFKYSSPDFQTLKQITELSPNPIEVVDVLRQMGLDLDPYSMKDLSEFTEIIAMPNARERLELLKNINVTNVFNPHSLAPKAQVQDWINFAKDKSIAEGLTPEIQDKIANISSTFGEKVGPANFQDYLYIAKNPKAFELVCALGGKKGLWESTKEKWKNSSFRPDYDIAHKIRVIQEDDLTDDLLDLLAAGFDSVELSNILMHSKGSERLNFPSEVDNFRNDFLGKPEVHDFLEQIKDKDFKEFTADTASIQDKKLEINDLDSLPNLYGNQNFLPLLYTFRKFGQPDEVGINKVDHIAQDPNFAETKNTLLEKGFHDWANTLQNNLGDAQHIFSVGALADIYQDQEIREKIATEEGMKIIKFLTESKPEADKKNKREFRPFGKTLKAVLTDPSFLENLNNLRTYYGYYYGNEYNELEWLAGFGERPDKKARLEKSVVYLKDNLDLQEITKQAKLGSIDDLSEPSFLEAINNSQETIDPKIFVQYQDFYTSREARKAVGKDGKCFSAIYNLHKGGLLEHRELHQVISDNLKDILDQKIVIDPEIINKHQKFYLDPKITGIFHQKPKKLQAIYDLHETGLLVNERVYPLLFNNVERLISIPKEKRDIYVDLLIKIDSSPSQEIQRVKDQVLEQILANENPVEAYAKIESVFIKNNLPTAGKVFKIFNILYPAEKIDATLKNKDTLSPYLRKSTPRRRTHTIYRDLLKTHIQSANRNLRDYLTILQSGQNILERAELKGAEKLDESEQNQLKHFLLKIQTLFANSQLGERVSPEDLNLNEDLLGSYQKLRNDLGAKEGQTITQRISDMFLKPLGYQNIEEVLAEMKRAKNLAHQRGLDIAKEAQENDLTLEEGDLLKGVDTSYISLILQNGSVCKELLGPGAGSDQTPFDADTGMVLKEDSALGFSGAVEKSVASGYGNLLFVMKNRGQYQITTQETAKDYDPNKLELFLSGDKDAKRHYGVRTGFPTTEIDFMIAKDGLIKEEQSFQGICFEISQNGYYIPIVDTKGKIIFTPEQYQELRKNFDGLERFDGDPFKFTPTNMSDINYAQINDIVKQKTINGKKVETVANEIKQLIGSVLKENGIEMKEEHSTSIVGAELLNTGSTGRNTNLPGNYDFDLTLRLDATDADKVSTIVEQLVALLKPETIDSHALKSQGSIFQLRTFGSKIAGAEPMDIDVGFVKKSELVYFGSHDAVQEKLDWIKDNIGESAALEVVANIVLTKNILKENKAYKKEGEGGMGGIGVENWILDNNGNMLNAFESFIDSAYDEQGRLLSLQKFKEAYKIIDPGMNVQKFQHDNFVENLKENGYKATAGAIKNYLGQESKVKIKKAA